MVVHVNLDLDKIRFKHIRDYGIVCRVNSSVFPVHEQNEWEYICVCVSAAICLICKCAIKDDLFIIAEV